MYKVSGLVKEWKEPRLQEAGEDSEDDMAMLYVDISRGTGVPQMKTRRHSLEARGCKTIVQQANEPVNHSQSQYYNIIYMYLYMYLL